MKEHLDFKPVEGVQVAITLKMNDANEEEWFVQIINKNDFGIDNVLIVTKGYGTIDGEEKKTSILRHMLEHVPAQTASIIEPIQPELFQLSNEFWVSYYIGRQIYDKKFVFVAGSVMPKNLTEVPYTDLKGVLHS